MTENKDSFRKHRRNVSTVSTISCISEDVDPLERESGAEVKVVLLLDSWSENNSMYDIIGEALGNRGDNPQIENVTCMDHRDWDNPIPREISLQRSISDSKNAPDVKVHRRSNSCGKNGKERSKSDIDIPGTIIDALNLEKDNSVVEEPPGKSNPDNQIPNSSAEKIHAPLRKSNYTARNYRHSNSAFEPLYKQSLENTAAKDKFFRFTVDGQPFRLMVICKERRKILKNMDYDFLVVGMKVIQNLLKRGNLERRGTIDKGIWQHEWEWLEKLTNQNKKAILMLWGYFREEENTLTDGSLLSLLKLERNVSVTMEMLMKENKKKLEKLGKKVSGIPRMTNFHSDSTDKLYDFLIDLKKLYYNPGYLLEQFALINNIEKFEMVLKSPLCTDRHLAYNSNETKDNPVMVAAKLRHKDLITVALSSPRFDSFETDHTFNLERFLHSKNKDGQTLLHMVAIQGPELEQQKLLILRREIQYHCHSDLTHDADQIALQRCLRSQLKSSEEAVNILDQVFYLQGMPKTEHELKMESCKVWCSILWSTLILSTVYNVIDYGSDILILYRYCMEWLGKDSMGTATCLDGHANFTIDTTKICSNNYTTYNRTTYNGTMDYNEFICGKLWHAPDTWNYTCPMPIQCFPLSTPAKWKVIYTLTFILVPFPFFLYEFATSRFFKYLMEVMGADLKKISRCKGLLTLCKSYLNLIGYILLFVSSVTFWPMVVVFIKFYNDGRYYLSKDKERCEREKKRENSEVLWNTARVMEVSVETSFQPTVQLYLLFPTIFKDLESNNIVFKLFKICKGELASFEMDQTVSVITSILTLSWSFTSYHAVLKRGALEKDLAAIFYRIVLYLANLFQILGRMFILVFFAYALGPGKYHHLLYYILGHSAIMSILHFVFSDAKDYWKDKISFFHYMVGNGLANIYIHNWVRMDPILSMWQCPKQHISTFVRQLLFDSIFAVENVGMIFFAVNSNIRELKEYKWQYVSVFLGFYFLGLILKCVYYRYLHMWAWLIMDYTTIKEDGHWKCILFSNMYLFGDLAERRLTLCSIPRLILKVLDFFCGSKHYECTDTSCSLCSAVLGVILFPIVLIVALPVLGIIILIMIIFLPVLLFILPPYLLAKYIRRNAKENMTRLVENGQEETRL